MSILASETQSLSQKQLAFLTRQERERLNRVLATAKYRWSMHARPSQIAPLGDWLVWMILAGRGHGKTRAGAEWVREQAMNGRYSRMALVGKTPGDVRDVMIEGESGILAIHPKHERPQWNPSIRRLTWPNGAIATTYSSFNYDELRGPQHDGAWCDELCKWKYPRETWNNLMLGLRLGAKPQVCVTTTPSPIALLNELLAAKTTAVTRGTTYENLANLAPSFREQVLRMYEGTRIGRQELLGEVLSDSEGALWKRENIERTRVVKLPELRRVVVAIDPAATSKAESNETGIIVAATGIDGHGYILNDATLSGSPDEWARAAVSAYSKHRADRIVAETNQGGDMVEATIRTVDPNVPFRAVYASRGKVIRAEPIAALYEQGRIHHVGAFSELEDQLCQWVPGNASPDRLDALVWALSDLFGYTTLTGALMA